MMRKVLDRLMKERVRVEDRLRVFGGRKARESRGIRMPDGSPVTVETIMKTHGVTRERATEIARRQTR